MAANQFELLHNRSAPRRAPSLARRLPRAVCGLCCAAALILAGGCANSPYRYGRFHPGDPEGLSQEPVVVEYGKPHKTLDRLAWLTGIPDRLFTLNSKASSHQVSPETIDKLTTYLEENDLTDVLVSVNDYDPKGQWRRLRENDRVAPLWRYSAGTMSWLGYVLIPNRVVGGDYYDPFTNTLNVTSDVPALLLAQAAYAKDIHSRSLPGTYAAVSELPGLSFVRSSRATSDVVGYARLRNNWEDEKEAYQVLYPHVGSQMFGPAAHFVPVAGPFLSAGGALAGHATGRAMTAILEPEPIAADPENDSEVEPRSGSEATDSHLIAAPGESPDELAIVPAGYDGNDSPASKR
jgi:hypothetical protein